MKLVAVLAVVIAFIAAVYLLAFRGEDVEVVADDAYTEAACPAGLVPSTPFDDVPADSVHADAIDCVVWWNVAAGVTDSEFAPDDHVTRAQLASALLEVVVATEASLPDDPPEAFGDDDGSIHEQAIDTLAAMGIVSGTADGRFSPQEPVDRGQLATFLHRVHEAVVPLDVDDADRFDDDDGSVHEGAIDELAAVNVVSGIGERRFAPTQPVTRAQLSSFIARLLHRLVEADAATLPYREPPAG